MVVARKMKPHQTLGLLDNQVGTHR
ncbi:hypothetical protein D047_0366A, partial [Vibrio parahaemolyticus VPTS-2010_2]